MRGAARLCAFLLVTLGLALGIAAFKPRPIGSSSGFDATIDRFAREQIEEGRQTFRYDTFGDEAFWGGALRLHEAIQTVSPRTALAVGLKVDQDALPRKLVEAIRAGNVNLDDPQVTLQLLRLNAVVGVTGFFSGPRLTSMGIQCAFCHSTVDNSTAFGVGHRLDGWANRDLDVGTIVSLAPNLTPFAELLGVSVETVRTVLTSWGPGKFDAELILDGKAFRPDGRSAATLIPPAFGLAGVNLHTWTGWGSVTHWNAFVSNLEMRGSGTFYDPRLNDPNRFPIAAREGFGNVRNVPDLITPKLAALHAYQLAIPAPRPPDGDVDEALAAMGEGLFQGKARCATCHVPPLFTEPGWNMHTPEEIGIDSFQSERSPDGHYRTAPLKGLWTHTKGGFYHDGRFATLREVIDHYEARFTLGLVPEEKRALEEYLMSLGDAPVPGLAAAAKPRAESHVAVADVARVLGNATSGPLTIEFETLTPGTVACRVYDLQGRVTATIASPRGFEAGAHRLVWNGVRDDGKRAAAGVYFVRLSGAVESELRAVLAR